LAFKGCLKGGTASVEIEIAIEIGKLSGIDFDHDFDFDFDTDPDSAQGSRTNPPWQQSVACRVHSTQL
jgi:hypothetical protein